MLKSHDRLDAHELATWRQLMAEKIRLDGRFLGWQEVVRAHWNLQEGDEIDVDGDGTITRKAEE